MSLSVVPAHRGGARGIGVVPSARRAGVLRGRAASALRHHAHRARRSAASRQPEQHEPDQRPARDRAASLRRRRHRGLELRPGGVDPLAAAIDALISRLGMAVGSITHDRQHLRVEQHRSARVAQTGVRYRVTRPAEVLVEADERVRDGARLTHFGFRDYDASAGVWTSKDPIRLSGGLNQYAYALSNPVHYADPTGRGPEVLPVMIYYAGVGLASCVHCVVLRLHSAASDPSCLG